MPTRKIGFVLVFLGVFAIIASLFVGYIGLGDKQIGSSQLLGIICGILIAIFGLSLAYIYPDRKFNLRDSIRSAFDQLLNLPAGIWVVIGFLIVFVVFYLSPVFLNAQRSMLYFNRYIPDKYPIGLDLGITMGTVTPWVTTGASPYPHLFYPPLTYIIFAPMSLVDYPFSYILITFLTFFSYSILGILALLLVGHKRDYSILTLIFLSGLLSYGFQFELERGQFNVITFLLCMLSIYIFHRHYDFRYLAYLLLSISIHIKVYPAIFILMLIKDWRDWKANIKRLVGLGLFNFALLFVLGYQNFLGFVDAVFVQLRTPGWSWNGNHSIQAFLFNFSKDGYGLLPPETLAFLQQNSSRLALLLLIIILSCILSIVVRAYLLRENFFHPYLLLVCTLGALIIPTSNDYTLPILVAPLSIFLCSLPPIKNFRNRPISILLILMISIAYSSLLYPFKYKPYYLNNSFLPLFVILIIVTLLYFLRSNPAKVEINE